jgi:NitT/TauT family transport system substrate-binding protein
MNAALRLAAAMGLAVAAGGFGLGQAFAQDLTKVVVAVPNPSAINNFPLHTAIGEGIFKKNGLEVTVEAVDGSSQVLQAMASNQAQIGQPGPAPVLAARARGEDVVFIFNHFAKSVFGVLVQKDSKIETPADLKGTVIGVGTADGAEVGFTRAILNDLGLKEGTDYTFLPVGDGGLAAAAFLRGDIVAYAGAVSDAAIMESKGLPLREITPPAYLAYFGNGYAAMASYIKEHPDVIEKFGKSIVEATRFALEPANREKVLAHTTAGNPQEGEDPAFANALFDAIVVRIQPNDMAKGWGYQPPEDWQKWHDSQVATGTLKAPLNVEDVYTNDFVAVWNEAPK